MCEKFLTLIPKRGRGKTTVLFKDEPCKAEMLNFGIFVLISNRHRDPRQTLTHYRRRNDIEMSYHMIKSELDGARARCWDMKRVRVSPDCARLPLLFAERIEGYPEGSGATIQRGGTQQGRARQNGWLCGLAQENESAAVPGVVRLRRDRHRQEQTCQDPLVYRKHDERSLGTSYAGKNMTGPSVEG